MIDTPLKLTREIIRENEKRILIGLAETYYDDSYAVGFYGVQSIPERSLAPNLGYKLVEQEDAQSCPPADYVLAARMLESDGYVQRFDSGTGPHLYNIWITPRGLDQAEYLQLGRFGRSIRWLRGRWGDALISVVTSGVTTFVTVLIMRFLGLLGLSQ